MHDKAPVRKAFEQRINETRQERERSRTLIATGRAKDAEEDPERRKQFAARMHVEEVAVTAATPSKITPRAPGGVKDVLRRHLPGKVAREDLPTGAERRQGDTVDFVDAVFLALGARAARAVGHVVGSDRASLGSGFMISPQLFITNNHVLLDPEAASEAFVAFNFEVGEKLLPLTPTLFRLRPDLFFHHAPWKELDYSIVAVGEREAGSGQLADQGFCPLTDRADKHAKGAAVNIVQHPNGWYKKIVLRENRIVARQNFVLHYEADTETGSSGSPVFNDAWEVVALHHWGEPYLEKHTPAGEPVSFAVNEGVRVSSIVADVRRAREEEIDQTRKAYLTEVLEAAPPSHPQEIAKPSRRSDAAPRGEATMAGTRSRDRLDGAIPEAVIRFPVELSIRIPGLDAAIRSGGAAALDARPRRTAESEDENRRGGPEKAYLDKNYGNRRGYDAAFLSGFPLPLGGILKPVREQLAPLKGGQPNSKAGELRYQHFSVFVHEGRKLPLLTATNIDGYTYVDISRTTGLPSEGPEGDTWYNDPRMEVHHYLGQKFYGVTSTYFDRGHLTRRTDPTWGTEARAIRANADTFHRSNCAPQHWLFNQSLRFWQGIERHYLEFGATIDKSRITVLQGPIFEDGDPTYEDADGNDVQVPLAFWKLIVRVEDDTPKVSGFIASHEKLLSIEREFLREEKDEKPDVGEFLASVPMIERVTALDFSGLREHDTYEGPEGAEGAEGTAGIRPIQTWDDVR